MHARRLRRGTAQQQVRDANWRRAKGKQHTRKQQRTCVTKSVMKSVNASSYMRFTSCCSSPIWLRMCSKTHFAAHLCPRCALRSVRLGAPYTSRCKERIFFNLVNRVVDFVLEALDLVLQWLLLLPFLHELRCKAGDFSALCTTAQAKHGGLPASFEQIELISSSVLSRKATASTSTPSGFVPCLSTSLQSIASEGKPSKAAVARSSKTRNPKGRGAVEGDAPPDSRRAGRQASADLLMHDSCPSGKKRNPVCFLQAWV